MALRFLSTKEVSERLGVKNASEYKLPEPDVYMALLKVSYLNNSDWNASRPGRGVGGGRSLKKKD